jgi:hypothetical protein
MGLPIKRQFACDQKGHGMPATQQRQRTRRRPRSPFCLLLLTSKKKIHC